MFNDAVLPEDEAWAAMTRDLTEAKKARTEMERENLCAPFAIFAYGLLTLHLPGNCVATSKRQ